MHTHTHTNRHTHTHLRQRQHASPLHLVYVVTTNVSHFAAFGQQNQVVSLQKLDAGCAWVCVCVWVCEWGEATAPLPQSPAHTSTHTSHADNNRTHHTHTHTHQTHISLYTDNTHTHTHAHTHQTHISLNTQDVHGHTHMPIQTHRYSHSGHVYERRFSRAKRLTAYTGTAVRQHQ